MHFYTSNYYKLLGKSCSDNRLKKTTHTYFNGKLCFVKKIVKDIFDNVKMDDNKTHIKTWILLEMFVALLCFHSFDELDQKKSCSADSYYENDPIFYCEFFRKFSSKQQKLSCRWIEPKLWEFSWIQWIFFSLLFKLKIGKIH